MVTELVRRGCTMVSKNGAMAAPAIFASPCNYELLEKSTFSYEKCTGNKQPKFNFSILSTPSSGLTMQKGDKIIFDIRASKSNSSPELSPVIMKFPQTPPEAEAIDLHVAPKEGKCTVNQNQVTCTVTSPNEAIEGTITLTEQTCSRSTAAEDMDSNYTLYFSEYLCGRKSEPK